MFKIETSLCAPLSLLTTEETVCLLNLSNYLDDVLCFDSGFIIKTNIDRGFSFGENIINFLNKAKELKCDYLKLDVDIQP